MISWHPANPPAAAVITPPIPNNIDEGHHDLETVVVPSEDAEPAIAPTEFEASTPPTPHVCTYIHICMYVRMYIIHIIGCLVSGRARSSSHFLV